MQSLIRPKQIYFYLLLLCSIGIGLQVVFYKIAIIGLLLQWIISAGFKHKMIKLRENILAVGMIALYFLYALSLLWSDNIEFALSDLFLKSPILILPLIIASQERLTKKQISQILLSFALSSLFLNFFCLIDACISYMQTSEINEFFYHKFTVNMHSAYQAMYTCFSIAVFIYLRLKQKYISNLIMLVAVFLQLTFILVLSSRMQLLVIMVLIPITILPIYYRKSKLFLGITYVVLIFLFGKFIMSMPSALNYRFKQTVSHVKNIGVHADNSDPRKFIWSEALIVIKDNWLIGTGVGDVKDELIERYSQVISQSSISESLIDSIVGQIEQNTKTTNYLRQKAKLNNKSYQEQLYAYAKNSLKRKKSRYRTSFDRGYNFHNQYLQIFGAIGIFGFLLIMWLLLAPFFKSLKNQNYLLASFIFIVGSSLLTESMLERQAGVIFVIFFYLILTTRVIENKPF